jgi:hypothetical protein
MKWDDFKKLEEKQNETKKDYDPYVMGILPSFTGFFADALKNIFMKLAQSVETGEIVRKEKVSPITANLHDKLTEQFFNPKKNIFPKTDLRPTALSNADTTQVWRSLLPSLGDSLYLKTVSGYSNIESKETFFNDSELPKKLSFGVRKSMWSGEREDFIEPNLALGNYTTSIGKDSLGHYLSIYDSWDFNKPGDTWRIDKSEDRLGRNILNHYGKGFNVYDRIYFTPDTSKYDKKGLILPAQIPVKK